jgi:hypothetical protein
MAKLAEAEEDAGNNRDGLLCRPGYGTIGWDQEAVEPLGSVMVETSLTSGAVSGAADEAQSPAFCTMELSRPWLKIARHETLSKFFRTAFDRHLRSCLGRG